MTKKIFLLLFGTASLALVSYGAFVQMLPFRVTTAQNQNDTNLIRVQEYLRAPDKRLVLVGSSLTFRLPPAILGDDVANLGLAGDGPRTGLQIISQAGVHPQMVLVEMNLLLHPPDTELVGSQLRFPEYELRKFLRAFRTGYDPVNLLWRGLVALTRKSEVEAAMPPQIRNQFVELQRKEKSALPEPAMVRASMAGAKSEIEILQRRGIRVGLLEMPIDETLIHSNFDDALRRQALQAFPESRFCWVRPGLPGGVRTLDGIHLTQDDAALIARQVVQLSSDCRN